ncbi:heavy-metal-associated domain-containing protein [Kitasatospora acidiphila]
MSTAPVTTVLTVDGMSCGHCERTVSAGLLALPGVPTWPPTPGPAR